MTSFKDTGVDTGKISVLRTFCLWLESVYKK